MKRAFEIRDPAPADRVAWEELWQAYLGFYESVLPPGHGDLLWRRLLDSAHPLRCLVAELNAEPARLVGIAHFFPHVDTWEERPVCYLQDLYVVPDARRRGVGEALIRAVDAERARQGWQYVYWHTGEDNATARRLYDAVTGGPTGFISYQLGAGSELPPGI